MGQNIIENARSWSENKYFSESDRAEIRKLLDDLPNSEQELTERFYRDLEFGTGGLRAPMGMGQNRMNKYNVRRATQALANVLIKHFKGGSAVVSYDSRHRSKEFALEAAGVFAANGITAHVFSVLTPTPMLSFAVRHLKAQAGVMVTASHNPPIYNGYKAFWHDGAQVVPPTDKEIIGAYNELTDWNLINYMPFEEAEKKGLAKWTGPSLDEAFYNVIETHVIQDKARCLKHGSELSVVYTALHGTGQVPCMGILKRLGFKNSHSISEQAVPDGSFPTVKSPNPEDPKALKMAVDQMLKINADVAYGTDPDGDRIGVVVNNHGTPVYLNGNQIGALMLWYLLSAKKAMNKLPENPLIIKSIVTSPIQNAIGDSFGAKVYDTLTGFKWMAALIREHEEKKLGSSFVFASEESFGYMLHAFGRDKDGVSSVALMSEIALYYKKEKGKNLVEALDEIYEKVGFYFESLVALEYEGIPGTQKIARIMDYFRNYPEAQFAGQELSQKLDFEKDGGALKSNLIAFTFKNGNKFFLRPSGTEPKIKFYTMVRETEGTLADKKQNALRKVCEIEAKIKEVCERA